MQLNSHCKICKKCKFRKFCNVPRPNRRPAWARGNVHAQTNICRVNIPRARPALGPDRLNAGPRVRVTCHVPLATNPFMSKNSHRPPPSPAFAGHAGFGFKISAFQHLNISLFYFQFFIISREGYHKPAFWHCPGDRNRTLSRSPKRAPFSQAPVGQTCRFAFRVCIHVHLCPSMVKLSWWQRGRGGWTLAVHVNNFFTGLGSRVAKRPWKESIVKALNQTGGRLLCDRLPLPTEANGHLDASEPLAILAPA
jgi:hypothetical protein